MKFFLDTEFIELGRGFPITLISIGIVAENNDTYYAVSSDFEDDDCTDWLKQHVLPYLGDIPRKPVEEIAVEIYKFVAMRTFPLHEQAEFWGYYADYDWVVLCQIFGTMLSLPEGWPMYCNDLRQLKVSRGNPRLPENIGKSHNALDDAIWVREAYAVVTGTRG